MKHIAKRARIACLHASSLQMKLAVARWQGRADLMPQHRWHLDVQDNLTKWLQAGGFARMQAGQAQTKTAAKGRRSLASQRDSDEEFQFTLTRIHDAAE
ncbi:hypothetical protein ACHMW6_27425 [Pseudoduganella sp. UC29_106]|uniref:hypothetical protein n=1 Tax=Pseudoduganella sp. UC29_106 TaxID=3374553 RepID=UPI003757BF16